MLYALIDLLTLAAITASPFMVLAMFNEIRKDR